MKRLAAAVLLIAGLAGTAQAQDLCRGPVTDQPALDRFGDIPIGAERTGSLARLVGPCDETCEYVDRQGVRYVVSDAFDSKTLDFTINPKAVGPLGLSGRDTPQTAFDRLARIPAVRRTLHRDDGKQLIATHYCFRNLEGAEFALELEFEGGRLARYGTFVLTPYL